MHFSLQKKQIFYTLLIVASTLLMLIFVIYPCIRQILSLQKNITSTEQYLEDQYNKTKLIRRSMRELNSVFDEVKKYEKIGILKGDELSLITELEQLAYTNLIQQKLNVTYLDKKNRYNISFVNSGDYSNQLKYFKALEELPYYLIIDSIQMEKTQITNNSSSTAPTIVRFNATVYEIIP